MVVYLKDLSPYLRQFLPYSKSQNIIRVNLLGNHSTSCYIMLLTILYLYTQPINKPTIVFPIRFRYINPLQVLPLSRTSTQELSPLTTSLLYYLRPNLVYRVNLILYLTLIYPRVLLTQALIANSLCYTQRFYKFSIRYCNKTRNF